MSPGIGVQSACRNRHGNRQRWIEPRTRPRWRRQAHRPTRMQFVSRRSRLKRRKTERSASSPREARRHEDRYTDHRNSAVDLGSHARRTRCAPQRPYRRRGTHIYARRLGARPFGGTVHNRQNPFFFIRGFATAFGGSYLDGLIVPVNYRFEPYGYERYEILHGPNSTLYGQSDPGGLVNRVSKRPPTEQLRELQI